MTRIAEFRVEGFKRINLVEIRPDGAVVVVSGRNGQGKTSLLDAVAVAFGGRDLAPSQPIKKGRREAEIKARLDDGTKITRRFWLRDGDNALQSDLKVEAADGMPVKKAQSFLDERLGALTFNPLAFAERMKPKEQHDLLRGFVANFDFALNAAARQEAFDARTIANRVERAQRASADLIVLPAGKIPEERSASDLLAEINAAMAFNADIDTRAQRRRTAAEELELLEGQIEQMTARATSLRQRLEGAGPLPERKDVEAMHTQLHAIEETNVTARNAAARRRHEEAAAEAAKDAAALTEKIAALDKKREDAIASAQMPVPGLSFGDDEIFLNGIPFSQASGRDRLVTSIAVGMALNSEIKVMLVDEGSSLDRAGLQIVADIADANAYQVWLVRVEDADGVGFVIEDGNIHVD